MADEERLRAKSLLTFSKNKERRLDYEIHGKLSRSVRADHGRSDQFEQISSVWPGHSSPVGKKRLQRKTTEPEVLITS